MKNILISALVLGGAFLLYHFLRGSEGVPILDPHTSIGDITQKSSSYTGNSLHIKSSVLESTTLLNYTKSTILDNAGDKIVLIGNIPYQKGDEIDIKVHLYVLYQAQKKKYAILVDDDFKMVKDMIHVFETQLPLKINVP